MQRIISICIIAQLLYLTPRVESQNGPGVTTVSHDEFPFVASLQYYPQGKNFCSGTLITKKHVITTKDCIENKKPVGVRVVFGSARSQEFSVAYRVTTWITYDSWAARLGMPRDQRVDHGIAIVQLTDNIYEPNVRPVRLSEWNKKQIQGKKATMIGWHSRRMDILQKFMVNILSDEDCLKNVRLITNNKYAIGPELLCTHATPYLLLECEDSGAPILDDDTKLLGVNFGNCPDPIYEWGNNSESLVRKYRVNLHCNVDYYRSFIVNTTNYH